MENEDIIRFETFVRMKKDSPYAVEEDQYRFMYAVVGFPTNLEGDTLFLLDAPVHMDEEGRMAFTGTCTKVITGEELVEHYNIFSIDDGGESPSEESTK